MNRKKSSPRKIFSPLQTSLHSFLVLCDCKFSVFESCWLMFVSFDFGLMVNVFGGPVRCVVGVAGFDGEQEIFLNG